jgi:hypothetical protein
MQSHNWVLLRTTSLEHFLWYETTKGVLLKRIITGIKTRFKHITTVKGVLHNMKAHFLHTNKIFQKPHQQKAASVFHDTWDIMLVNFLPRAKTISAQHNCSTVNKKKQAVH